MKNHRVFPLVALLVAVLFLLTCSSDSPTESDDGPEALASATIGPSGGELSYDDFVLTVPAGAFAAEATLRLYLSDTPHPFDQQVVSAVYRLTGLPESYTQPLNLQIRYDDSLVESSYLVFGGEAQNPCTGQSQPAFRLVPALESSGFLAAELPVPPEAFAAAGRTPSSAVDLNDELPIYLVGATGYEPPLDTGEFRFILPNGLEPNARRYLPFDFCRSIDSLQAVGLSFERVPLPIEVYVYYFATPETPEICLFLPSWGRFALSFDRWCLEDWYDNREEIRYASIRECVHTVACTYDNSYFNVLTNKRAIVNPERLWLHQAVASCMEEKMYLTTLQVDFKPLEFNSTVDNRKEPFAGLQVTAGCSVVESRNHGGGMSALMKHLTNSYGDGILWSLYEHVDNNEHPATAVRNLFSEDPNVWYPAFVKDYLRRNIYGGPFGGQEVYDTDVSGGFSIAGAGDTLRTFTGSYRDISTKIYTIDLDYSAIDTIQLSISSSNISPENLHLIVCGYKDALTDPFLSEAGQEVTIPDALALKANGVTQLWVVVVNSAYSLPNYDGGGEITLTARAVLREGLEYNRCLPWFDLYCYFTTEVAGTPPDTTQTEGPYWPNWEAVEGTFSGLVFTADWNTTDSYNRPYSGVMEIILDPSYDTVLSYEVEASIQRNDYQTQKIVFNGYGLPVYEVAGHTRRFRITGTEACPHILSIADTLFTTEPSQMKWLDSVHCLTDSYIDIYFYTLDD